MRESSRIGKREVHASTAYRHESMVSFVSRRYIRVVNGSLVVCLSEYLPLHIYILVIKV